MGSLMKVKKKEYKKCCECGHEGFVYEGVGVIGGYVFHGWRCGRCGEGLAVDEKMMLGSEELYSGSRVSGVQDSEKRLLLGNM